MASKSTLLNGESQNSPTKRTLFSYNEGNNPQDCHGAFDRFDSFSQKRDNACYDEERPAKRLKLSPKAVSSYAPSLLGIPVHVRQSIYRYLLLESRPIGFPTGCRHGGDTFGWAVSVGAGNHCNVSAGLLCVCRQISMEASPIFYGENTFAFKIWEKNGEELAPFLTGSHIAEAKYMKYRGVRVEKMEQFLIKVEVQGDEEFEVVRGSLLRVCEVLSENPKLHRLDIFLEDDHGNLTKPVIRVLEPFTILRDVDVVNFWGVPPLYAHYLQTVMTKGPESLDDMPKRYFEMQQSIGWENHLEKSMRRAMEEMERGHSLRFETCWLNVQSRLSGTSSAKESDEKFERETSKSEGVKKWLSNLEGRLIGTSESNWNPEEKE